MQRNQSGPYRGTLVGPNRPFAGSLRIQRRTLACTIFARANSGKLLILLFACASLTIGGCKATKQTSKNTANTPRDSLQSEDTSKSEVSKQFDSIKNKVSNFLTSLLPPSQAPTREGVDVGTPKPPVNPPVVQPEIPNSGGFLSSPIKRRVEFDSSGEVIVHNQFLGSDVDQPMIMSFDDYIKLREQDQLTEGFKQSLHQTEDTSKIKENGLFPTDFNSITIPIPPSIVPSIFGKPSINLKVNGDVAVHIAYRDNQFLATQGALFSGSETGLDFKQEINVSTTGTIGDKMKIGADWGSDRSFQFENLLHLGYTGYPDEILQSIEAGNVSLNTPSKYIGIQEALFGLKAVTRFGPVYVTELAAQKKGDHQTKTFGGGAGSTTATEHIIQPANYRRNAYFVDTSYIKYYEQTYSGVTPSTGILPQSMLLSGNVEVWRWTSSPQQSVQNQRACVAIYNLASKGGGYSQAYITKEQAGLSDTVQSGGWIKLDTSQYSINLYTGVLTLNQEPSDYDVIGMSYQTNGGQYGDFSTDKPITDPTPLVLKLIKPALVYENPSFPAWTNILKNSYYIGGSGFDLTSFSGRVVFTAPTGAQIEIVRSASGTEKAISALGLDRFNNSNPADQSPDGLVDVNIPYIVDSRAGTLTFPYLQPFGSRVLQYYNLEHRKNSLVRIDSTFYFPELYTQTPQDITTKGLGNGKNNQLSINVKFTGGVSSLINLNAFNLVQGSVRVTVNGNTLVENQDYRVDYNSGTIQILNPDLVSTGQVQVDYETNDIFTNATKSVLGLRAEVPILDRGLLGLTLMNYSLHLPTIKTRQGEEPLSNWMLEADAAYHIPVPQITDFLNYLPLFNLKDKSDLSFKVDAALSLPSPNTQISPMGVDNNAPIAYLDDFEGGENEFPLSMSYGKWVHCSQPVTPEFQSLNNADSVTKRKGKAWWFSVFPQDVLETTIRPQEQVANPSDVAQVLDLCFDPTLVGAYNHHSRADIDGTDVTDRWGGMMQYAQGLNVPVTNTDAIDLWVNVPENGGNPNGVLKFDMGIMSEDVIPDSVLENEDQNLNGRYDPGEDVGLDTIADAGNASVFSPQGTPNETSTYPNSNNPKDPNNDDYTYNNAGGTDPAAYYGINGTEGNQNDQASLLHPDTEDLNGNRSLDLGNAYYEYSIPIDMTKNKYVVGSSPQGWYELRIPIAAFDTLVGLQDTSFSNISYFRFWMQGYTKRVRIRMNNIMLVGSQWARALTGLNPTSPALDTTLRVSYVGTQNNAAPPTNYTSPPGATGNIVPGATTYIQGNEQSLDMTLSNVPNGSSREVLRNFQDPNNLFNYKSLAIFVYGDPSRPKQPVRDTNNAVYGYIRIGTNQYNYYEYRMPLGAGWQNMHVDFATLTTLKGARLPGLDTVTAPANDGNFGSKYRVVGSPNLTDAPYFVLGVENETHAPVSTSVWWDELRLLTPNVKPDYAMNASTTLQLAEFGKISASIVNERPDFVPLDQRFNPDHNLNFNWNVTGSFAMQKIFPKWLEQQSVFPLTVSHTETILSPKYLPNTDVEVQGVLDLLAQEVSSHKITAAQGQQLSDSIRLSSQTLDVKNTFAATGVKLVFPGSFFLLPGFFNRLVYGFGYSEEYSRTPQYEFNNNWQWTGSIGYDLPKLPDVHLSPWTWWGANTFFLGRYADWRINFLPQNMRFAISATRGRVHSLDRSSTVEYPPDASLADTLAALAGLVPTINRIFTAKRGMQFQWKITENGLLSPTIDYALDVTSNLVPLETNDVFNQPVGYDANHNPIYYYDSVYSTQRSWSSMMRDVFFKNGAFVTLGKDILESQRVNLTTNPRMPWFFTLEKYIRPVFSYHVDYRWQDAQTGLQISKTAAWNNTITTGLEFNVRDLGAAIFGKASTAPIQRGGRVDRGRHEEPKPLEPEQIHPPGFEERSSPPGKDNQSTRNPVDREDGFRPQSRPNPLGNGQYITDTLFHGQNRTGVPDTTKKIHSPGIGTEGERDEEYVNDTTLTPLAPPIADEEPEEPEKPPITIGDVARALIEKPLFDWNGTRFNFIQNNSSLNPAVAGSGPGITNFLARGIFSPEDDANGPSRAYQLGLITDPAGRLLIGFKPTFPFVTFNVRPGLRAVDPAGSQSQITDIFTQQNNFELTTSRPLWDGANLSMNWKVAFSYQQQNTENIDAFGNVIPLYTTRVGDVSRSFLSIPPLPFLNIAQSGILEVGKKYQAALQSAGVTNPSSLSPAQLNKIETESFMNGFESLPFFSGFLREYLPRLNYAFNWVGLEKFPLFSFADHASFRNAYNGDYRRSFRENPGDSVALTTVQTVSYGFRPLAALDLSWDKIWGGRMTTSVNYDTQTEWDADYSSQRINKRLSQTFGVTANWNSKGLSIPFLKLNVKNEVGMSLTVSYTNSADSYNTFDDILTNQGGTGNGGLEKLTFEPRASYSVSQQLTIESFFRYERTTPATSGQLAPPTRLIMAGFDIRLKIQ